MRKLLWLDDELVSISYEKDVLIPEKFPDSLDIITFEKINELLEYLSTKKIDKKDIFVVDIMLLLEYEFITPEKKTILIENDLMAGTILYREYLKAAYPDNPILLYTSRENEKEIFKNILNDERHEISLFLIEKSKKDTLFLKIIEDLLKESS